MPRRLVQQVVIVLCAVALLLVPLVPSMPTVASQTPSSFHWARKQTPFTIQAGDNMSGSWTSLLRQTVSQWNKNTVVTIKEVAGGTGAQNCAPRTGRIEVCNWRYGTQEGWLGLTRLYFNAQGDHVEAATVQMNDSFFDQNNGQYNSNAARLHTICHELGHAIGLDHVDTTSCMNDSQYAVFNYVKPINKDFRELASIYKHKDSTTTVAGKQKKEKKAKKNKKGKNKKNKRKQEARKAGKARQKELRKQNGDSGAEGFFEPTALPAVPSGLDSDETVTVQRLDDGRTVVTFITWAAP